MRLGISGPLATIAGRYLWSVPVVAVLGFVGNGLEGLSISLLVPLLGDLFSGTPTELPGPLASLGRLASSLAPEYRLYAIAGILLGATLLKAVVVTVNTTIVAWVDGRAGHEIRSALSRKLLRVPYDFHLAQDPARLVTILGTEAWRASDAIRTIFSMAAAAGAVAVFALILLLVEWRLSLAVFAGVVLIRLLQARLVQRLKAMSTRVSAANRRLSTRMLLGVDAARLIRVFAQEEREEAEFRRASEDVRRSLFRVDAASAPVGPVIDVLHAVLFVAILIGSFYAGVQVPILVAFLVLLYRMQPHLRTLSQSRLQLAALRGPVAEVEWLLEQGERPIDRPASVVPADPSTPIIFENVGFGYPNRPDAGPVLVDASFRLLPNRATALIGRSGSGKTTIVNLLCKLIAPTSGRIVVGDVDLAEIDSQAWLSNIALAGQDIDLVDGTIAENIAYGRPGAMLEEIIEAARSADADSFVAALPDGYRTMVGARGLSLSGGQRQRIGIARALLRKPKILILDEAMSAVDTVSESAVTSLLATALTDTTVLVISHRPSTLACCQDGICLENGRVTESGPLRSLSAYCRLLEGGSPEA